MENKKLKVYFSLVILIIICLIVYGLYVLFYRNDSVILDSSKDIVYTSYENEEYNQKIPNINIKKLSTQINNSIEEFTKEYKDVKTVTISYHYQEMRIPRPPYGGEPTARRICSFPGIFRFCRLLCCKGSLYCR